MQVRESAPTKLFSNSRRRRLTLIALSATVLVLCALVVRHIRAQSLPILTIYDVTLREGEGGGVNNAVFTVSLTPISNQVVTVNYATANNSAQGGTDYTTQSGTLTFNVGETTKTITVPMVADCAAEFDESFFVILSGATNATINDTHGLGTILSDDQRNLTINDATVFEGEGGSTNAIFTVTLNGESVSGSCGPVTVNYATANNSALGGTDYTAQSGTLTFNAGETTKTITVPVVADCAAEFDELFLVNLSSATNATINDTQGLGTILSEDQRNLTINDATVFEGEGGSTNAIFTVTLNGAPVNGSCGPVTVNYATANNSAQGGTDYTAQSGTLTFNAGETTKTITVPVVTDCAAEFDETFLVNLSGATNATINDTQGLGTILSDDQRNLTINDATVIEGEGGSTNAIFTVTLNGAPVNGSCGPVTVNYATANNSAQGGTDYTVQSGTLTFNPGETTKTITVPVVADCAAEFDELFLVNLSGAANATINDTQGLGTIFSDDQRSLTINDATVTEGEGGSTNAIFTVTLNGAPVSGSCGPVTVNYATANNSALGGTDYTAQSGTLTFNAGETAKTITVPVVADCATEFDENFSVNLSGASNATINDTQGLGTILSDDNRRLTINDVSITEPSVGTANAVFIVGLNGDPVSAGCGPVTVNYATANNSAQAGSDYVAQSGTLTFNVGEVSKTITVSVNADALQESTESFLVNLTSPTNALLTRNSGIGSIIGTSSSSLSINDVTLSEGEGGSANADFTVNLSVASAQTVTVNYTTANSSATAGSDYTAQNGTLTFAPGETTKTISVPVAADCVAESDESFIVNLSNAVNTTISDTQGVATILSDDDRRLVINDVTITEGEGGGTTNAVLTLTLSGDPISASCGPVTVNYATANSSATAGSDYTAQSGTLTFNAGEATKTITVPVAADCVAEGDELFVVNLTGPANARLFDTQGVASILSDDDRRLVINDVTITEGEGGGTTNAVLTLTLSGDPISASCGPVTVNYATANSSAQAGSDYTAQSGTLTFNAGEATKTITVPVATDCVAEGDELFVVNLTSPANARLLDTQGVATILSEDDRRLVINDVTITEGEGGGTTNAVLTVTLSGDPISAGCGPVTVNYATANSSAQAGSDYTAQSGTLTFNAGEATKTITVPVAADCVAEGDELFVVNLTSPANARLLDTQGTATILSDDDRRLVINDVTITEGEGGGTTNAVFTVTWSGDPISAGCGPVTVNYATANSSAQAGSDYTAQSGTLTFNAGEATKTITVPVAADCVAEGDELFVVSLTSPANARLFDTQGVATILSEDDRRLVINDVVVSEGDGNAVFTVTLTGDSVLSGCGPVTANFATANSSAQAGNDYTAQSGSVTFNSGDVTKTIAVPIISDGITETTEIFLVSLTNANGARFSDSVGVGTILNNDSLNSGFTISGKVTDGPNTLSNVPVNLTGTLTRSTNTDAAGNYVFSNVNAGGNYTVTPTSPTYSFSPIDQVFNNLSTNRIANFVGTQTVVSITGNLVDANDAPLNNVTIALTKNGVASGTTQTDALGNYSFNNQTAGANYVVTPTGSFTPLSQTFSNLTVNANANFRAAPSLAPQCNTTSFSAANHFLVGTAPRSVTVADFNKDGKSDLAVANFNSGNVSILLGTGTGGFGAATNFALGVGAGSAQSVVASDFNGDDKLDLVVANVGFDNVSVLLGSGTGSFSVAVNFPAGISPQSVTVGDFNSDGKADLAVANFFSSLSVLIGTGTGSFSAPTSFPVGGSASFSISVGDFNGDGKSDLVTANQGSNNVSILLGTGTGSFSAATTFAAGISPFSVATGDFNSDGKIDLTTSSVGGDNVSILLGSGNGSFGVATNFVGGAGFSIAIGDFNNDGKSDLATAKGSFNVSSVLLGSGMGTFGAATDLAVGSNPFSVGIGDFNSDGKSDLATANENSNNVSILLNTGTTCFSQTSLSISGQVKSAVGSPLADVAVTLSGPITRVATTDASGNYSFANLAPGGNYAITVQSSSYVFAPTRADLFNLSSNQIVNFNAAPNVVPLPTPTPNDSFNTPTRDPERWNLGTQTQPVGAVDPQVTTTQVNGQLVIKPVAQAVGLHYNGYVSANSFDFRNGTAGVELVQAASGGADSIFAIGSDRENFTRFVVHTAGGPSGIVSNVRGVDGREQPIDTSIPQLIFQVAIGGQPPQAVSIPYDAVAHRHLRFRHEAQANAILFETSPNNIDFMERHRVSLSKSVSALTAELSAGTPNPTNPGTTIFDNFNLVTSTYQFSAASYTVGEGEGSIVITVTRQGSPGVSGTTATVEYQTTDGTAHQSSRYIPAVGTLTFAPGQTSRTFTVLVVDNVLTEGNQTVNLLLGNALGSGLNTPGRAVLTIVDNDTLQTPLINPVETAEFFAQQHYLDFFSRTPDASGLAFWASEITSCGADEQCKEVKRINVSAAFFLSIEFQQTGYLVERIYKVAYGDGQGTSTLGGTHQLVVPIIRREEFIPDTQEIGLGVVVGATGWEQHLESNKVAFVNGFVQRTRFRNAYANTLTPEQFVDLLFQHAGVTPTAAERTAAINEFAGAPTSSDVGARGRALRKVAEHGTLATQESNRAFVLMQYFGYLRRNPNDPQDTDYTGYDFWLTKLNQFGGNFVNAEMVKAFILSGEYIHRFGP